LKSAHQSSKAKQEVETELKPRKSVIATAINGLRLAAAKGELLEANETYAKVPGHSPGGLKGMHISPFEAKEGAPEIAAHIAVIPMQSYGRFEARHRHKNGYYSSCR